MEINYHGQKVEIDLTMQPGEKEFDTNNVDTDLENTIELPPVQDNVGDSDAI